MGFFKSIVSFHIRSSTSNDAAEVITPANYRGTSIVEVRVYCMHMFVHVHQMRVYIMFACMHMLVHVHLYILADTYVCTYIRACIRTCMHTYVQS